MNFEVIYSQSYSTEHTEEKLASISFARKVRYSTVSHRPKIDAMPVDGGGVPSPGWTQWSGHYEFHNDQPPSCP